MKEHGIVLYHTFENIDMSKIEMVICKYDKGQNLLLIQQKIPRKKQQDFIIEEKDIQNFVDALIFLQRLNQAK